MTIKDLCKKIPDDVRSQRLLTKADPIHNATPSMSDPHMALLVKVWETFIEPDKEIGTCPICLGNIKTNFVQMYDFLVDLEESNQMLDMI